MFTKYVQDKECVIIVGTYINACTIAECLQKINYEHQIVLIDPVIDDVCKCLADIWLKDVIVIKKRITKLGDIVDLINNIAAEDCKKTILMTAEEFIDPIKYAIQSGTLKNTVAHTGAADNNDIIFDRFLFYRFVERLNCINVPKTIDYNEDPQEAFGEEFVIRVKKSWEEEKKLPRLEIVHSRVEQESVERRFQEQGLTPDMWCYQELLSTLDTNNVSVCGWYDSDYHQYVVTRKVVQHPPKIGNGDVVEVYTEAPESIVLATETILKAMRYTGAFEMEFVFDTKSNNYKIIELNPRFWMQHGLVEEVTDNSLIRRAIGEDIFNNIDYRKLEHRYWINGNQLIYRVIKGQIRFLSYLKKGSCYPKLLDSARWLCHYNKYKRVKSEE